MSVEAEATVEPPVNAPPEAIRMRTIIGLSIWSLAGTAILAAYSLFLVGLVLHQLGPERFAPWAAAVALVGYLSLLDTGLTSTTTRDTARAAAGHADAVERVQAASTLFAFLAAAAGSFGLAASFVIPRILGLTGDPAATATAVAVILVVDLSVVLSTGGWLAILRGLQRYDLLFLGSLVHVTVGTCLTLALIGPLGIPGAATAQLGGRLVSRVVIAILVSRHAAWFHLRPRAVALRRIRDLWTFSIPIFAIQLATQIGVGTDIVVVGLTAGAVAVGLYAAGSQLVRNVSLFLGPTLSVLLPILSRFTVRGSGGTSSQLPTFVVMGGVLGGAIFGGMCLEASTIVQLWTGSQPQLTVDVLRIYSIAYILITPVQMLVVALIAVGRHQILGGIVLVTALLNLGLSAILGSVIGPIGVAVGTLIMVTFDNGVVIPVIASGRLAIRRRTLYSAIVLGIAIGVGIVASSELLPVSAVPGLFARVGYCIVLTAVALAIVWRGQVFGIRPERSVVQRA